MAYRFPSEEWTQAFHKAVNESTAYRGAAQDWTHGAVAMVIEKDESIGLAETVGMILDVDRGSCRNTRYVKGTEEVEDAPFVIVASYQDWKSVVEGSLDPIHAMLQGRLKLTKGHLPTMIRDVEASRELVRSAAQVPTKFIV